MNSPYEKLRERLQVPERPIQALIGLDGFVDTILHVVDQRYADKIVRPENQFEIVGRVL